jgi:hypothetical protein
VSGGAGATERHRLYEAKCQPMTWRDDFQKLDEAINIATVIFLWLCFFAFVGYVLYRAFR